MSYHRAGSHKSCVIVASQLFQKTAHCRTFNIEASFCFTNPEIFLYLFIVFKFLHCMNINIDTPVAQNYFSALADMTYSPLAQNVEFFKANLFGSVHIPLGCWKPFWRHIESGIAGNRFFRDEYTPGMDTPHIGKVSDFQTCRENNIGYLIAVCLC